VSNIIESQLCAAPQLEHLIFVYDYLLHAHIAMRFWNDLLIFEYCIYPSQWVSKLRTTGGMWTAEHFCRTRIHNAHF